jgi:hypothetical protein
LLLVGGCLFAQQLSLIQVRSDLLFPQRVQFQTEGRDLVVPLNETFLAVTHPTAHPDNLLTLTVYPLTIAFLTFMGSSSNSGGGGPALNQVTCTVACRTVRR